MFVSFTFAPFRIRISVKFAFIIKPYHSGKSIIKDFPISACFARILRTELLLITARLKAVRFLLFFILKSAPYWIRNSAMSMLSFIIARCNGVFWFEFNEFRSAPYLCSVTATSILFSNAAKCKGVH